MSPSWRPWRSPPRASRSSSCTATRSTRSTSAAIDVQEVRTEALSREEIERRIKTRLGRKIVVVGACTGSDAHTVGIDAILNYKGYAGDKGLESYKGFEVHNLGAQVENEQLAARARALKADAILVSQVITQRNCHKENGRALVELLEKRGLAAGRHPALRRAAHRPPARRSSSGSTRASGRAPSRATWPRTWSTGSAAVQPRRAARPGSRAAE